MALELEMLEHRRVYDKGIAVRIRDFCFGDPNPEGLLAGVRWSQIVQVFGRRQIRHCARSANRRPKSAKARSRGKFRPPDIA